MVNKQCIKLEQRSVINFLLPMKCKPSKFTKICMVSLEKNVLDRKMFTEKQNMACH